MENSKEMAILARLSRKNEFVASRKEIGSLLWSSVDQKRQQDSLRQSVRKLRRIEAESGVTFLNISNSTIGINKEIIRSDVDEIHDALSKGKGHNIAKAHRLLAPAFLDTCDKIDPKFSTWRKIEARNIRDRLLERAAIKLSQLPHIHDESFAPLARFMLKVDDSYEWAHQRLIQHYTANGRHDHAKRQLEECRNKLFEKFGITPKSETTKLVTDLSVSGQGENTNQLVFDPPPVRRADIYPVINVSRSGISKIQESSSTLVSEFVEQLSRNREFAVQFSPSANRSTDDPAGPVGLDDSAGGQFVLNINDLGNARGAHIELRSRREGQTIFFDAIPIHERMNYEDRVALIARSVLNMQKNIKGYYSRDQELAGSHYRKLSQVYDLVRRFDVGANTQAWNILDQLSEKLDSSSLVFAFRATLLLQKNLFLQPAPDSGDLLENARRMASKAIELDPWHALNHRYLSFADSYSGRLEDGRRNILIAQSLTPTDPLQTIATAEVCAFAGDIENALEFTKQAFRSESKLPRYSFGYLAIIHFAAGNFDEAANMAKRAPTESMDHQAIRIASLWELGQVSEARMEMKSAIEYLVRQHGNSGGMSVERICQWLGDLNPFANPQTKAIYRNGIWRAASG